MPAEILINVRSNLTRVAYVEDGQLTDLKVERKTSPTLVGCIYKGRVSRILPGMQAAFVDIGLDRAAFLYVGDIRKDTDESEELVVVDDDEARDDATIMLEEKSDDPTSERLPPIQELLTEGQDILVQVAKDPLGTKGARITTHISLPGRYLVLMPTLSHLGISRRIENEDERERLRKIVEGLNPRAGAIVRTAGEGASEQHIKEDINYLFRVWRGVEQQYEKRKTPGLVYSELDVELRSLRDLLNEGVRKVIVDDSRAYKKINNFVGQFMPSFKKRVSLYKSKTPLFDYYDLDLEISRSLGRRIWLKSGGYIVIDEAEALVVIDINTGRYVGKKDLEDTIVTTNIEAAREVAHQLRIRNCGGIIIVDFIDMEKEVHREKVVEIFREELARDRARTEIVSMSELGLVEMTRKRIRPSLVSNLCEPCPYCEGRGYIKKKSTVASEIFRGLERDAAQNDSRKGFVVHCHAQIADWIYAEETEMLEFIEKKLVCPVAFKVEPSFHLEQFRISSIESTDS